MWFFFYFYSFFFFKEHFKRWNTLEAVEWESREREKKKRESFFFSNLYELVTGYVTLEIITLLSFRYHLSLIKCGKKIYSSIISSLYYYYYCNTYFLCSLSLFFFSFFFKEFATLLYKNKI